MIVRAPASSANLGPGFDCLGLALELPFDLGSEPDDRMLVVEPTHPASVAFAAAGGDPDRPLWWRSPIPPGRGMGFSGAARVAGAYLAGLLDGLDADAARRGAFLVASELEGHPDNAAASTYGGLTVAAGERVVGLPMPAGVRVVLWSPDRSTSTDASRRVLPDQVPLADATFSSARAALWVAAIAAGDLGALRTACQDRVHQPGRLHARPDAGAVLESFLADDAVLAAWLSGSGPTVAALYGAPVDLEALRGQLGQEGTIRELAVASRGVHELAVAPGSTARPDNS